MGRQRMEGVRETETEEVYSKHSGKPHEDFKQVSDMILII